MPKRPFAAKGDVPAPLVDGIARLAARLGLPGDFPEDVLREAGRLAASAPARSGREDLTGLPFVTIDPPGSKDLDQALLIERSGDGFRVWYAIVDVAAWVPPDSLVAVEATRRGQTYYAPNVRLPLYPPVLCEGAASLLPDGVPRPANVWRIDLDAAGAVDDVAVIRAFVASTAQLAYPGVQAAIEDGSVPEPLRWLKTVGELRLAQERARGGVSLNLPEQDIVADGPHWRCEFRTPAPVENWNAQISLLTGFCAAGLMRRGGVGILRTLPVAREADVDLLRHIAATLHLAWPPGTGYPDFVRSLDPGVPADQAMMNACTLLFRGAAYTVIGSAEDTGHMPHGALASEYAHTTAPLRRLVDRYTGEICAGLAVGEPVPDWVRSGLDGLPGAMASSDRRAKAYERGIIAMTEALVLSGRVGQRFQGVVIDVDQRDPRRGVASVPSVAVEAPVSSAAPLTLGAETTLTLTHVDVAQGQVAFTADGPAAQAGDR